MADISYSVSLRVSKDNLDNTVNVSGVTASMNLTGLRSDTYTLSSTAVGLSTANLGAVGLAYMRNLSTHTASTCAIGIDAGGSFLSFATLRAGEVALLRLSSGTEYEAKGTTGTRLRVDITEG
jgi:hypothetical protein